MQLIRDRGGVSLMELVIAIFLVSSVVAGLSMTFPKASESAARTQQRSIATNLAQAQLQIIKSSPYDYTDVTNAGMLDINCDCATVPDLTVLPSTGTAMAGTTFFTAPCVHFVIPGSPWTSQCYNPADPGSDTGYKHIVVYVYWNGGTRIYSTSQESLMTRT